jgi:RNA polymerase-binding transcription factor DksA
MSEHTTAKTRLEAQLAELTSRLGNLEIDLAEPADPDWEEHAVQMEDDDSLAGQATLVRREISATNAALSRIADGTYGACTNCGADISSGRLEASPEAATCIDCAKA